MKTNTQQKIMHVNYTMNIGGIESFIMNVLRNTDIPLSQIVILTYSNKHFDYEAELAHMGVKIIRITDPHKTSFITHIKEVYAAIASENVDVVHAHTYFDSAFVVAAAALARVKVRITHSHTAMAQLETRFVKKVKWTLARILMRMFATHKIACSDLAGKALFGSQKFSIVPNGINIAQFAYNEATRRDIRNELNIGDAFVIGHVGRLDTPKNHSFLLDIFKSFQSKTPNSFLVLVGSGRLKDEIRAKVASLGLEGRVLLLGDRSDIKDILNAFDAFVFPSIYEGLPVSLIEAQSNGLPVSVSDTVTHEVEVTNSIEFISLDESPATWASRIKSKPHRASTTIDSRLQEYDIRSTLALIEGFYTSKTKTAELG